MFTGIVEGTGTVVEMEEGRLSVSAGEALQGMRIGDSIAVNGVCLTITSICQGVFSANVMPETLRKTNLVDIKSGDPVNLERPLTPSSRMGGHFMQGHVDGRGTVLSVSPESDAWIMEIGAPAELMSYVVTKGFIGVDGTSLTVVDRRNSSFTVSLVSYTWEHTTLGRRKAGDLVNLEVDILAKYVEQLFKAGGVGGGPYTFSRGNEP